MSLISICYLNGGSTTTHIVLMLTSSKHLFGLSKVPREPEVATDHDITSYLFVLSFESTILKFLTIRKRLSSSNPQTMLLSPSGRLNL